ncbi:MAG: PHP domain-containing protein, partial [Pseudonocardiaceae bacterium]
MGWNNPPVRWADLERALSGRSAGSSARPGSSARQGHRDAHHPGSGDDGGDDGGDSPAWTRHRERYEPPTSEQGAEGPRVPYAELHCHSNFSFLDGAGHPEELVEEAARLGLDAVAITDHDGMY